MTSKVEQRDQKASTTPDSVALASDIAMLKEYGFKKRTIGSRVLNRGKIDHFGMRQLDRLKMLLLRNERLVGSYPPRVRRGIERNDPNAFAFALAILSPALRETMS